MQISVFFIYLFHFHTLFSEVKMLQFFRISLFFPNDDDDDDDLVLGGGVCYSGRCERRSISGRKYRVWIIPFPKGETPNGVSKWRRHSLSGIMIRKDTAIGMAHGKKGNELDADRGGNRKDGSLRGMNFRITRRLSLWGGFGQYLFFECALFRMKCEWKMLTICQTAIH